MLFTNSIPVWSHCGLNHTKWCKWQCSWEPDQGRPSNITRWALVKICNTNFCSTSLQRNIGRKPHCGFLYNTAVSLSLPLALSPSLLLSVAAAVCLISSNFLRLVIVKITVQAIYTRSANFLVDSLAFALASHLGYKGIWFWGLKYV